MIPYKDDNPTSSFPFVTVGIIAINIFVYIWELISPMSAMKIVYTFGAVPASLLGSEGIGAHPIPVPATLFTSMFIHAGFLHLAGNMLYLWIFGDNIEDRFGHFRYLLFYLLAGVVAVYSHSLTAPDSRIPMVGASGAVAGVLGAYMLIFPGSRVYTLIFFGFFFQTIQIPALIVIGFWAIIQLLSGMLDSGASQGGGVAWFAHVGGFLFGLITVMLFIKRRRQSVWS